MAKNIRTLANVFSTRLGKGSAACSFPSANRRTPGTYCLLKTVYCLSRPDLCLLVFALGLMPARVLTSMPAADSHQANPPAVGFTSVACRVLEVFVAEQPAATVVIFHQRDKADGARLGDLLLAHSGCEVEFVTDDGKAHRARVFRMKSCFGRGLLVLASGSARLAEKDDFVLRFPMANETHPDSRAP